LANCLSGKRRSLFALESTGFGADTAGLTDGSLLVCLSAATAFIDSQRDNKGVGFGLGKVFLVEDQRAELAA